MGLGPTVVGGAIGAVVGMLLHLLVEVSTPIEAPWFAIIIGLTTGLGVHQANKSLAGRVSYARGAIAAAIALAAIVGSTPLISLVKSKTPITQAGGRGAGTTAEAEAGDGKGGGAGAAADVTPVEEGMRGTTAPGTIGADNLRRPGEFNVWQFVFMAVGTFIAYEFGRGSSPHAAPVSAEPPTEPMTVTDPSN